MSNKLTFEEFFFDYARNSHNPLLRQIKEAKQIAEVSWNFAQDQEQKEYKLLEAEHSILLAQFSKVDLERLRLEKEAQAKQAMYDEKYTEIHKANVVLMDERDIIRKENDSLWVENEDLTRKIEKLEQEVARLKEENLKLFEFKKMWQKASPYKVGD